MRPKLERLDLNKIKKTLMKDGFREALKVKDLMNIRYTGGTRDLYMYDIELFLDWCYTNKINPMNLSRVKFEEFGRFLMVDCDNGARSACRRMQTVRTFYRLAMADFIIFRDPTYMAKFPKWEIDPDSIASLSRGQVYRLLQQAEKTSPDHHALTALMSMLGLRVSEVCSIQVEDIYTDGVGYTKLRVLRKGGRIRHMPVPIPLLKILNKAIDGRRNGPLIRTRAGNAQNRRGAYDWFKRLAKAAELPEDCHPHTLRHAAITALIDAGEPIQRVQEFADHRDIRTTEHYYRRKPTYEQHASHVTARLFAYPS